MRSLLAAVHEAGHATAFLSLPIEGSVRWIAIDEAGGGHCRARYHRATPPRLYAMYSLGALAGELRYARGPGWVPVEADLIAAYSENATRKDVCMAIDAVAEIDEVPATDTWAELVTLWGATVALIDSDWSAVMRIAHRLQGTGYLSGAEIGTLWLGRGVP